MAPPPTRALFARPCAPGGLRSDTDLCLGHPHRPVRKLRDVERRRCDDALPVPVARCRRFSAGARRASSRCSSGWARRRSRRRRREPLATAAALRGFAAVEPRRPVAQQLALTPRSVGLRFRGGRSSRRCFWMPATQAPGAEPRNQRHRQLRPEAVSAGKVEWLRRVTGVDQVSALLVKQDGDIVVGDRFAARRRSKESRAGRAFAFPAIRDASRPFVAIMLPADAAPRAVTVVGQSPPAKSSSRAFLRASIARLAPVGDGLAVLGAFAEELTLGADAQPHRPSRPGRPSPAVFLALVRAMARRRGAARGRHRLRRAGLARGARGTD